MKPDWYDDPDDPKAERWWDGHAWGPNRRRKQAAQQTGRTDAAPPWPATPPRDGPSTASSDSNSPVFSYPAFAEDHGTGKPEARDATGSPAPPVAKEGRTNFGISEALGLLMAFCGVAFVTCAFAVWGRVRASIFLDGTNVILSAEYPGVGSPSRHGRFSDGDSGFEVIPEGALHNSNPGWIALAFGIVLLAAAAAYYLAWNRKLVGIASAALSAVVLIVCISYLTDVRGAFGDPAILSDDEFSPGVGLIGATALSVVVIIMGMAAFAIDQRSQLTASLKRP